MRKLIAATMIAGIFVLLVILAAALRTINKHDISIQKAATCNLKVKGPIYLITYAEGDIYVANEKMLASFALNNCIDMVYTYRKAHLDTAFVQKNKKILEAKRGAGYWLWKPYLILRTLNEMPENAIIIYLDAGIKIVHPIDKLINDIEGHDMILVYNTHTNKQYTRRYLFKLMNMDNEYAHNAVQLNAGVMVLKNTKHTREFIQKWLVIAENPKAINDDKDEDAYPEFKDHRHDQSILSLVYLQNPDGIKVIHTDDILDYVYWHRRDSSILSLYMMDYIAKDWPSYKEYIMRMTLFERVVYNLLLFERKFSKELLRIGISLEAKL